MRCSVSFIATCVMLASAANAAAIPVKATQSAYSGDETYDGAASGVVSAAAPVVTVYDCESDAAEPTRVSYLPLSATGASRSENWGAASASSYAPVRSHAFGDSVLPGPSQAPTASIYLSSVPEVSVSRLLPLLRPKCNRSAVTSSGSRLSQRSRRQPQ